MKVWLVWREDEFDNPILYGVYNSEEKAKRRVEELKWVFESDLRVFYDEEDVE